MLNNKVSKKKTAGKASKTKTILKKKTPKKAKASVSKKASVAKKAASPSKSPAKKSAQKEEVKHQPKDMWDYFELDTKYKKL
jgi:hypothetical protein